MLRITKQPDYSDDDVRILTKGLDANASKKKGHKPMEFFALFLRDDDDKIAGGCDGLMYYGCLFIDQLWIDEQYRGQDYGSKLLAAAEDLGKQKGCLFSTLETMDWEALEFYKKLGYYLEYERHGYVKDSVLYSLRKDW